MDVWDWDCSWMDHWIDRTDQCCQPSPSESHFVNDVALYFWGANTRRVCVCRCCMFEKQLGSGRFIHSGWMSFYKLMLNMMLKMFNRMLSSQLVSVSWSCAFLNLSYVSNVACQKQEGHFRGLSSPAEPVSERLSSSLSIFNKINEGEEGHLT